MQTLLRVVVAQVLEGCAALAFSQPRVLKAWCVHNEQRAQGMLAGFQGPEAHSAKTHTYTHKNTVSTVIQRQHYIDYIQCI